MSINHPLRRKDNGSGPSADEARRRPPPPCLIISLPPALFYRLAYAGLRAYWFVFRPRTRGVRCLVERGGRILLIRHTYGSTAWTLPGGGLRRNEAPEAAVRREVSEEVGVKLSRVRFLGEYTLASHHRQDVVKGYHAAAPDPALRIKRNEIREAAWFDWGRLPTPLSADAESVIRLYRARVGIEGAGDSPPGR